MKSRRRNLPIRSTGVAVLFYMGTIMLKALLFDDSGGEVLEYALIAGLIVVAAIAVITSVGSSVLARWTSVNSSM